MPVRRSSTSAVAGDWAVEMVEEAHVNADWFEPEAGAEEGLGNALGSGDANDALGPVVAPAGNEPVG
jgi:hypothetical protein